MNKFCLECGYWTKNSKFGWYKCYCGDCPAKIRDTVKGKHDKSNKSHSIVQTSQENGYRAVFTDLFLPQG